MANPTKAERPEPVFSGGTLLIFVIAIGLMALVVQAQVELPPVVLIGLVGGAALGLFTVGLTRPEVSLLAVAAYMPFSKVLVGDFSGFMTAFNLTNILLILVLMGHVFRSMAQRRPLFESSPLNLPAFLFCLLGSFSLVHGVMSGYGEGYGGAAFIFPLKRWLTPVLLYFIAYNVARDRITIQRVTIIIMIVVTMAALMAIKDYIDIGSHTSFEKSRVEGIAGQPNMLGAFFVYYMFLFAGFWTLNWGKGKYWLLLVPFLLCFRGIQVTFSRGAYLAFAVGALGLGFFRHKLLWTLMLIGAVSAVLNPWMLPEGIAYRIESTFQKDQVRDIYEESELVNTLDTSAHTRLEIWGGAIEMIKEHPLQGVGYGAFPYLIRRYVSSVKAIDAHNSYLLIAAEMGIPTLIVFLWIVAIVFFKTRWLYLRSKDPFYRALALGWLGGLTGLLAANMFGSRLHSEEVSSYFWIISGLIMRAIVLEKNNGQGAGGGGRGARRGAIKPRLAQ